MSDKIFFYARGFLAFSSGILTYVLGSMNELLIVLLIAIILDYISGVISGAVNHKLSSQIGFIGILRKVFILLIIALAHIIDRLTGTDEVWRNMVIVFYLVNELLSIIENANNIGLPIPNKLKRMLDTMRKESDTDDTEKL